MFTEYKLVATFTDGAKSDFMKCEYEQISNHVKAALKIKSVVKVEVFKVTTEFLGSFVEIDENA